MKPKKPKKPAKWHEQPGAGSAGKAQPVESAGLSAAGGLVALDLLASSGAGGGLSSVMLNLVGDGAVQLSAGLAAWQREQDRVANRAWRRPGGLQRMGGL
ncbi:MAG: hypothetical protein OJF49_000285 [Ktedonobacterales bacterium]|nr:MAG: hypothetical protein OJF49_000285 [Ktedonobacterales bacterium]